VRAATISVVDPGHQTGGVKPLQLILARELASNLATPMHLIDARGMLVFYNDAAAVLLGKSFGEVGEIPAEEFGALLRMKTPDGKSLRRRDSPSAIAFSERRPTHMTLAATGFDGVERLVHATAFPLFGTSDEMHGVVTLFWQVGAEQDSA